MSRIITLDHQPPKRTKAEQQDATVEAIRALARQEARAAAMAVIGPLAVTFREFMDRQAALEDHVGFTYVPNEPPPTERAVGAIREADGDHTGGDVEC